MIPYRRKKGKTRLAFYFVLWLNREDFERREGERMTFGIRLRELRENEGYHSQQALADALGVAQSTVANWERGRREPNYATTVRLARLLGVTTDYLLGLSDQPQAGPVSEQQLQTALFGQAAALSREELEDLWEDVREYAHYKLQQQLRRH